VCYVAERQEMPYISQIAHAVRLILLLLDESRQSFSIQYKDDHNRHDMRLFLGMRRHYNPIRNSHICWNNNSLGEPDKASSVAS
jgi:hypothetical protein